MSYFHPGHRPAQASDRCADCPHVKTCDYACDHYIDKQRDWLHAIHPTLNQQGNREEIQTWIRASPWGRCAWACDNDVVDHQVVSMDWGHMTASLTMTAFDEGRRMTLCGSAARLYASDADGLRLVSHFGREEIIPVVTDAHGHGSADAGLVENLASELLRHPSQQLTGIQTSIDSHLMAFASEHSRRSGGLPVTIADVDWDERS